MDIISLIKCSKTLRKDLFYLPYRTFRFDWRSDSDTLKLFIKYSAGIQEVRVDRFDFFEHFTIDLPNLRRIILEYCTFSNLKLLELYRYTLTEIVINNCSIEDRFLELYKYPLLKRITIDSNRVCYKRIVCRKKEHIYFDDKLVYCYVIDVV
jgi:hypothetical protein